MKAGTLMKIAADTLAAVDTAIIGPDDEFVAPTPQQDAALAVQIERIFRTHGVDVPVNVDRIVQSIPLIVAIFGAS